MYAKRFAMVLGIVSVLVPIFCLATAADKAAKVQRDALMKAFHAGNYKDAYDGQSKLALDPKADPVTVGHDLNVSISCLHNLGRSAEIDDFREAVVAAHSSNGRLLQTAAESYVSAPAEHFG